MHSLRCPSLQPTPFFYHLPTHQCVCVCNLLTHGAVCVDLWLVAWFVYVYIQMRRLFQYLMGLAFFLALKSLI